MTDELYHYGILGMKWGKHNAKRDLKRHYKVANAEKRTAMLSKESEIEDEYFKKLDANKKTIAQEKKADKFYGSKTEKQLQAEYLQKLDDGKKEIEKMFNDKYGKQTMADAEKYVKRHNAAITALDEAVTIAALLGVSAYFINSSKKTPIKRTYDDFH